MTEHVVPRTAGLAHNPPPVEKLFPFFKKIGTTLNKDRFPEVEFQGQKLLLPVAEIDLGPGGKVNLSPIGDYKQPLKK